MEHVTHYLPSCQTDWCPGKARGNGLVNVYLYIYSHSLILRDAGLKTMFQLWVSSTWNPAHLNSSRGAYASGENGKRSVSAKSTRRPSVGPSSPDLASSHKTPSSQVACVVILQLWICMEHIKSDPWSSYSARKMRRRMMCCHLVSLKPSVPFH